MGVPKFYRFISERYPCLSEIVLEYQIPEFDNFYLDVNGIVHGCSHPNDNDIHFEITEEDIFKNIFHYIEILFRLIQPQKLLFLAVDGVAPRAKINQQRGRRFRSAKEAQQMDERAKAKGIYVSKEKKFDSNCITPGTVFMAKLNEQLKYFITYKVSNDRQWQKCKIIFSGSEVPGEGEHKIMDYIRYMKSQPDYSPDTKHCLYGLDADLIMLGLCTHEPHFSVLREEVKFGKKQKKIVTPEETKFCLLHLSLLREYIEHEFSALKEKIDFFNIEKIIDDWVLMGFLVGNDFIPHLPNLHIAQGALPILYHAYTEVLPTLNGYINELGTLNLSRFEKFMEKLARIDIEQFAEHYADLKYFEGKRIEKQLIDDTTFDCNDKTSEIDYDNNATSKRLLKKELNDLIKSTDEILLNEDEDDDEEEEAKDDEDDDVDEVEDETDDSLDEESDDEIYTIEFVQHKRDYYMNKLEYEVVDDDVLRSQAEGYVRAIQWNLHYYYDGCCSWSWYYPHHYAPYISDIKDFKNLKLDFELGEPFLPFTQLLAVLPSYSKDLLPTAFQHLLTEETSPIINYYPNDFKTDLNGKRQEWEAVVLIPFIDEKDLSNAMEPYYEKLTAKEKIRNKHGAMCIFTYTDEDLGVYPAPEYFPNLNHNHANLSLKETNDIIVPVDKLVKGLSPGVNLTVYFPGFPTLQFIEHTGKLENAKVKVFEQPSRGENMILYVTNKKSTGDLKELASELLGNVVHVNWPHLTEAKVMAISNCDTKLYVKEKKPNSRDSPFSIETIKGEGPLWEQQKKQVSETYKTRWGINIGVTNILIHARPLVGTKYVFGTQGRLCLEKQWSDTVTTYAYQMIIKDISVFCDNTKAQKTVEEIFSPGSKCFMLGHPYYGSMAEVNQSDQCSTSGRIKVFMTVINEPNFERVKHIQVKQKNQYMPGSITAQRLGISSHLLSRVTGTIFVVQENPSDKEAGTEKSGSKYNIGLNLKFNKRNEQVLGYTKKQNGQWFYSTKVVEAIRDYMIECPELFENLAKNTSNDVYLENELFGEDTEQLPQLLVWLKAQEFYGMESRSCDAELLEPDIVREVQAELDKYLVEISSFKKKRLLMQVKSHLLLKSELLSRNCPPDITAQHYLFDRVICVRDCFTVPIGLKGVIIEIQRAEISRDNVYCVLFDQTFVGGLTFQGCSESRCYRLLVSDFVNISHGERIEQGKSVIAPFNVHQHEKTSEVKSWRRTALIGAGPTIANETVVLTATFSATKCKQTSYLSAATAPLSSLPLPKPLQLPVPFAPPAPAESWRQPSIVKHSPQTAGTTSTDVKVPIKQVLTNSNTSKVAAPLKLEPEFQALWNELHKLQQKPKDPMESSPSRPKQQPNAPVSTNLVSSSNVNYNSLTTQDPSAFLKAVLKINDDTKKVDNPVAAPAQKRFSNPPEKKSTISDAPPLVQQLFDRARRTELKRDKKEPIYRIELLTYYQISGIGMPRYIYHTNENNMIQARLVLPDTNIRKKVFLGEYCTNYDQAAESVAKKAFQYKANTSLDGLRSGQCFTWRPPVRPPMMPPSPSPINLLLSNQTNANFPKWNTNFQKTMVADQMQPLQHQQQAAFQNQFVKQRNLNEPKSEVKPTTPFVPLQAQKKSRTINSKQNSVDKDQSTSSNSNKSPVKQTKQVECNKAATKSEHSSKGEKTVIKNDTSLPSSKQQNPARPRRSRVAAKFGAAPVINGAQEPK
ncbi:5'-3' exoribonuclease 1 isoform X2 [Prorops nasuta]|uniref:5'-3' exoribonuclease 1 isoform X2 n=1 Tax=Prorops nasuta TaxID=863751 RepID=UPI0034CD0257